MSVAIESRRSSGLGTPKVLFANPIRVNPSSNQYAAAPDGRTFNLSERSRPNAVH
jgi:hypothetical protein